jgi:hypothetical protein
VFSPQGDPLKASPPSRIVLVGNYPPDKQESMSRFAELVRSTIIDLGFEVATIQPADRIGRLRRALPCCEKWLGYVDKYLIFPFELRRHARRLPGDQKHVYHIIDHSNSVYSFALRDQPRVITCHDVLAILSARGAIPENPTSWTGRILQKAILAGLRDAPLLVCVSDNTAQQLRRLIGSDKGAISTVLQPLNYDFHPVATNEAMRVTGGLGCAALDAVAKGCILHVGGNQWYKNRTGVFRIYTELARQRRAEGKEVPPLILAGKEPDKALALLLKREKGLPIVLVPSPGDEQLRALYSLARVLLYPSLQEGFGWPIAEAMACGCPVVTTGRAPMTEVGGDAAIYIDAADVESAALAVNGLLGWNEAERAACVQRGFANVARFSRQSLAEHYAAAYREVLQA